MDDISYEILSHGHYFIEPRGQYFMIQKHLWEVLY